MISMQALRSTKLIKESVLQEWYRYIEETLIEYNFKSNEEIAAFMATLFHESAGLSVMRENLNYSAQQLANTWPNRYSSTKKRAGAPNALANQIARNPEAIANHTYANRMGNGDVASGDGYRYRGHGPIQNTGKAAAIWLDKTIGKKYGVSFVQDFAKLLSQPKYGMLAAGQYWQDNVRKQLISVSPSNARAYMDRASDVVNIGRATPAVGDAIGFADRLKKYEIILKAIKAHPYKPSTATATTAAKDEATVAKTEGSSVAKVEEKVVEADKPVAKPVVTPKPVINNETKAVNKPAAAAPNVITDSVKDKGVELYTKITQKVTQTTEKKGGFLNNLFGKFKK